MLEQEIEVLVNGGLEWRKFLLTGILFIRSVRMFKFGDIKEILMCSSICGLLIKVNFR